MDIYGIQKARKKAGITQDTLAAALGISRATVSKYESGLIAPSIGQMGKIARILNTSVYEMMGNDFCSSVRLDNFCSSDEQVLHSFRYDERFYNALNKLNEDGKQKALERIEELAEIPRYQKVDHGNKTE